MARKGAYGTFYLGGRYGQTATATDANGATTLATYDEWGRTAATWSALDRPDRPAVRIAYRDALCERSDQNGVLPAACGQFDATGIQLRSPALATTLSWDDQLPRCVTSSGAVVDCANAAAANFAHEQAPGGYRTSFASRWSDPHAGGQCRQASMEPCRASETSTLLAD